MAPLDDLYMPANKYRTSLRLSHDTYSEIDCLRRRDGGKVPLSTWIYQAIEEKIARDKAPSSQPKEHSDSTGFKFYEFFAGGGMARAGFGNGWHCLFANDFDPMKGRVYRENWNGGEELIVEDINNITIAQLPAQADVVWASFPCQDLSLAGNYNGIGHWQDKDRTRSGTFWSFWRLMRELKGAGRGPKLIVLENVYGVLTSSEGKDFSAIGSAFSGADYRFGAMVIDARHFLPHSRPRVFVVGVRRDVSVPSSLVSREPIAPWHPNGLIDAQSRLSKEAKKSWIWWNLPHPVPRTQTFTDLIEDAPKDVKWDSAAKTKSLLAMMSDVNREKLLHAQQSGRRVVGGVYKRTRKDEAGKKVQRAEVRFDDVAGCLRTPAGGSSRQSILLVEGKRVRSRLLSTREAARLMGLPDTYVLPVNYNDAYHVAGDGVAVPVVSHLATTILEPILNLSSKVIPIRRRAA